MALDGQQSETGDDARGMGRQRTRCRLSADPGGGMGGDPPRATDAGGSSG